MATVMLASSMMVGGGLALAGAAAAADGGPGGSGAVATLQDGLIHGGDVSITGDDRPVGGGLIGLKTDGGTVLETYCIDLRMHTEQDAKYQESAWSATSLANNTDKGRINWILQNSYPQVDKSHLGDLAKAAKVPSLNEDQAAAGTQAAIWHFSDHVTAVPSDENAAGLTKYLIDHATDVKEPTPSLTLTPPSVSGKSGALLGPITVSTTGDSVAASLDATSTAAGVVLADKNGTVLTDKNGKLLKGAKNNDQLFVKAPAGANAGQATITADTTAAVQVGRAFTSLGYTPAKHSQTLILAGTKTDVVSATAGATWAPTGPIPAISAAVQCQQSAVVVTATNNGDQNYTFTLSGKTVTVKPGETQSVPVPVAQGQHYDIKVTGLNGQVQEFQGILDCHVTSTTGGAGTGGTSATPSTPATPAAGSTPSRSATPAAGSTGSTGGSSLAFTGGGSSAPLLAGVAGVLMVAGGGAVFAMRRRGRHGRTSA